MLPARTLARAFVPLVLHALAREVDGAVGILLHTTLDVPDFVRQALGLVDPRDALRNAFAWAGAGAAIWWTLAWLERRRGAASFEEACARVAPVFLVLLLRPALTLIALCSLAVRPTYPYGFTLPVALTQDWDLAQDAAAAAAILALRVPRLRCPAPRPGELFFIVFLAYALIVPAWARDVLGHPGNEPKYLRMGTALGCFFSLDVDRVSAPLETLAPEPLLAGAGRALGFLGRRSWDMAAALADGRALEPPPYARVAHLTVSGRHGGAYHILAPGPALLLAPTLRLDRALNLARGTYGALTVSLLAWNLLAAGAITAVCLLARDATGRDGLATGLAAGFAFLPPFLFYSFQFYPELPAALLLALVFRELAFGRQAAGLGLGLALALLPWLHQKYLPVWALLTLTAVFRAVDQLVSLRSLLALLLPQGLSFYLLALYNFAITGSARPDALFQAFGLPGVQLTQGQGIVGLMLDSRYGILPYAPAYLLALGAVFAGGFGRLGWVVPSALAYYLTVASHETWSGAISNLGRFVLPLAPLAVALVGLALARAGARRGAWALALTLVALSARNAWSFWRDPLAANEATRLLGRSAIADGEVYVPSLWIRSFSSAAPGLPAQILVWTLFAVAIALFWRRAAGGLGGRSPLRALAGLVAAVLGAALLLERWPSAHGQPRFPDAIELRPGTTVFVSGAAEVGGGRIEARGDIELLVRSRAPLAQLALLAEGVGRLSVPGRAALLVGPGGSWIALPLQEVVTLSGRRGVSETLYRQRLEIRADAPLALRLQAGE